MINRKRGKDDVVKAPSKLLNKEIKFKRYSLKIVTLRVYKIFRVQFKCYVGYKNEYQLDKMKYLLEKNGFIGATHEDFKYKIECMFYIFQFLYHQNNRRLCY